MANMSAMTSEEFDSLHSTAPINPRVNNGIIYKPKNARSHYKPNVKKTVILSLLLAVGGITCCIIGVVFFEKARVLSLGKAGDSASGGVDGTDPKTCAKKLGGDPCSLSEEVKSSGLIKFFKKVDETYFNLNPHDIVFKRPVTRQEITEKFEAYNPKPSRIKEISDASASLLKELKSLKYKKELLKPREAKTLSKTIHFLEHNFGNPYDNGYYTGEWMLGPSRFCYMQKFYTLQYSFKAYMAYALFENINHFHRLMEVLRSFRDSINQYRENIAMGVKVGMVNSLEECVVGYDCLIDGYKYISTDRRPDSILNEPFVAKIAQNPLPDRWNETAQIWQRKYSKTLTQSLREALVRNLGVPLVDLFHYLGKDHQRNCVPSHVSSGLGTRPVSYVYNEGVADRSKPTTKTLPTGERVNGKKAYERILAFFTTTDITPDQVHKLGWEILNSLYPQMIEIAKSTTNEANETRAVAAMKAYLNSSEMFFNTEPFPANESDRNAHIICRTLERAKIFCPVRYSTLEKWFDYSQSALSMFRPKLIKMFHWMVGPKKTTPICPVSMASNFVPSSGSPSYLTFGSKCRRPAYYFLPFFLDRMGPKYSDWTVNAHEAMPGHHLQSQGYAENFLDYCDVLVSSLARSKYSNTAFTEGWGLYAENPLIAQDTDIYKDYPLQKFGMLKWQVWRALRLIVDTGLHYKGMTRHQALHLFSRYTWDESDVAEKEVTRYQSGPGQATAYMIGQRAIVNMRIKAIRKLGERFRLQDFHYYILSRGAGPINFVADQIDRYIECEKNPSGSGCELILVNSTWSNQHSSIAAYDDDLLNDITINPAEIHEF